MIYSVQTTAPATTADSLSPLLHQDASGVLCAS